MAFSQLMAMITLTNSEKELAASPSIASCIDKGI